MESVAACEELPPEDAAGASAELLPEDAAGACAELLPEDAAGASAELLLEDAAGASAELLPEDVPVFDAADAAAASDVMPPEDASVSVCAASDTAAELVCPVVSVSAAAGCAIRTASDIAARNAAALFIFPPSFIHVYLLGTSRDDPKTGQGAYASGMSEAFVRNLHDLSYNRPLL